MIIDFLKLVEEEHGGMRIHAFKDQMTSGGFRRGQAFMNALRGTPYYDQLTGSEHDVFYTDSPLEIARAIDFLTSK